MMDKAKKWWDAQNKLVKFLIKAIVVCLAIYALLTIVLGILAGGLLGAFGGFLMLAAARKNV